MKVNASLNHSSFLPSNLVCAVIFLMAKGENGKHGKGGYGVAAKSTSQI
jgi:hypothetical protein